MSPDANSVSRKDNGPVPAGGRPRNMVNIAERRLSNSGILDDHQNIGAA
jgi:hypothetical protein